MAPQIKRKRKYRSILLLTVLLVFVLAGSGWIALKRGIVLDHVATGPVFISGLSLRFDQGFIVRINRLELEPAGENNSRGGLAVRLAQLRKWSSLLGSVTINNFVYRDHSAAVSYTDGRIQVQADDFDLAGKINSAGGRFTFTGNVQFSWGEGSVSIQVQGEEADVRLRTAPFTDLTALLRQLHLDPEAAAWVEKNISAAQYQINELDLQINLKALDKPGPPVIRGRAVAHSVAIRFHPELPPVTCEEVNITYQDDRLTFNLVSPTYRDKNLAGSNVELTPLRGGETRLIIHLRTESRLDADIHEFLAAYDLKLPFKQENGTTQADLTLNFALPEFTLQTSGTFSTGQGQWQLGEQTFQMQDGAFRLDNDTVRIEKAGIIYGDTLRTSFSGSVDLENKQARLVCNVEKVRYQEGDKTLVEASNKTVPLSINYSDESVLLSFDELDASIRFSPDTYEVDLRSIPAVLPFVPPLKDLPVTGGNLHAVGRDSTDFRFDGEAEITDSHLSIDNTPVKHFRFQGTRKDGQVDISVNDGRIAASLSERLTVTLKDYLVTLAAGKFSGNSGFSVPLPLQITGPATLVAIKDFQVRTGPFNFSASGSSLTFKAQMQQGNITYELRPKEQRFTGTDLDAELAADFFPNMDMSKGTVNIFLHGKPDDFEGYLEMWNIHVRNTEILHNLLAFINTIPALATFSSPGFDSEGYLIREGIIHFSYRAPVVTIKQMRTDGTSVNIELQGWINRKNKTLKLDTELITLKDYSKIISKIPLAGYAILDEDGTLSTSLEISGNLDAPDIRTNVARDILFTPLNVIKRTIQWPFRLLDKAVNGGSKTEMSGPVQTGPDN